MSVDPRPRAQRRSDTEQRLAHDVDVWVATASADGVPYLVPLSFDWDGEALLLATPASHVKLALYGRALAKDAGVSPDGAGSHRIVLGSDAGPFTDPDRFAWETASLRVGPRSH